jgi:hypothetical protein
MEILTQTSTTARSRAAPQQDTTHDQSLLLRALIDPGEVFARPGEVLDDPALTDSEKRAVLVSWARDELVIEQVVTRVMRELGVRSRIDAVVDALAALDPSVADTYATAARAMRTGAGRSRTSCRRKAH